MSRHHKAAHWSNTSPKERARIKATLPQPCITCGKPIFPGQNFDVGHLVPISLGGGGGPVGPSHTKCNRTEGGRMGARKTNRRDPRNTDTDGDRHPQW